MLQDQTARICVKQIHRHPLRGTIIERLIGVTKHPWPIFENANDLNIALGVACDKKLKERQKTLRSITNTR